MQCRNRYRTILPAGGKIHHLQRMNTLCSLLPARNVSAGLQVHRRHNLQHHDQYRSRENYQVRHQIQMEKEDAIRDIRRQVAILSVDIAEKVIRKNLDSDKEQMQMIDRMLDELTNVSKN